MAAGHTPARVGAAPQAPAVARAERGSMPRSATSTTRPPLLQQGLHLGDGRLHLALGVAGDAVAVVGQELL
ncbi:hypothetical protein, partial [Streptomyces sp. NPDC007070]|uniref:hypothetical protein n=1 Tax=Streptomyces sp. NPDC007070 TaxID=3154312 RepID=UPI0034051F99